MNTDLMFSSATAEWGTPRAIIEELEEIWDNKFELDVCASDANHKCERYYTKEQNCFIQPWDVPFWCNPVYGNPEEPCKLVSKRGKPLECKKERCKKRGFHNTEYQPGCIDFVMRAKEQSVTHAVDGVFLVPARTDTEWWAELWSASYEILFAQTRIPFEQPDGTTTDPAPFPSAVAFVDGMRNPNHNNQPECRLWWPGTGVVQ